jgi:hypothetical protein
VPPGCCAGGAQETLAERIEALEIDVLCVQEVEDLAALEDFVKYLDLETAGFKHLSLVEGNDHRFIDVGVISKLPLGGVAGKRKLNGSAAGGAVGAEWPADCR